MSLPSFHLDAFFALAQTASFSKAAKLINITQSGLSQKIQALESQLQLTLVLRTSAGAILTESGERLLRYCQMRNSLEQELMSDLHISQSDQLSGLLRIASYSTVYRSVLIPALTRFLVSHPRVRVEFICAGMDELPVKLQRAEADFIVMDYKLPKENIEALHLGYEKYVVIKQKVKANSRTPFELNEFYLDNNAADNATEKFFERQSIEAPKYQRHFFDDCYGIIDGVARGIGRAVMPEHIILRHDKIAIETAFAPMKLAVTLQYYRQAYYSKLQQAFIDCLTTNCPKYLSQ